MELSEIRTYVKDLAEQDLSITDAQVDRWLDSAIDRINTALESNYPKVTSKASTYIPEIDERYHEALVLFANAKYRESDADFQSAMYFMNSFNDMLMDMQRDMEVPPSFRKNKNTQQIVVTNPTTIGYNLNIQKGAYFNYITVYINDVEIDPRYYTLNGRLKSITFKGVTLTVNDKITVIFEDSGDLNQPPYTWWNW